VIEDEDGAAASLHLRDDGVELGDDHGREESLNAGAPERIRTPDPQIRSLVLYPAELPVRAPYEIS
jgi:hypothetical protein